MCVQQIKLNDKAIHPIRHLYLEETTEGMWIELFDSAYQKKVLNPILVKLTGLDPFYFVKNNADSFISEQLYVSEWLKKREHLELRNNCLCLFIEDITLDALLALTNFKHILN